jgi:hypothetical protein
MDGRRGTLCRHRTRLTGRSPGIRLAALDESRVLPRPVGLCPAAPEDVATPAGGAAGHIVGGVSPRRRARRSWPCRRCRSRVPRPWSPAVAGIPARRADNRPGRGVRHRRAGSRRAARDSAGSSLCAGSGSAPRSRSVRAPRLSSPHLAGPPRPAGTQGRYPWVRTSMAPSYHALPTRRSVRCRPDAALDSGSGQRPTARRGDARKAR